MGGYRVLYKDHITRFDGLRIRLKLMMELKRGMNIC